MTPRQAVEEFRRRRAERLRSPDGWLTLVGLSWLKPGENRVGADADADVILRGLDAPGVAGTLEVEESGVRFVPAPRADVTHDGRLVEGPLLLAGDEEGDPTVLAVGSLRFHLIRRAGRLGIRVRDTHAEALRRFRGIDAFPIDPSWRVTARFEATPDRSVDVPDVVGLVERMPVLGVVTFEHDGAEHRLEALEGDAEDALWLIFGDATNGAETYPGGRFLYTEPVAGDRVVVDFNLAYNPPCVFTPYATCPLPWPENRLAMAVTAGERQYRLD